ncbi:recombinase family protein [Anaerocolumna sp. MB42-C2]|uniref:recombinase family protein n=1 Tax=Anaerocolumna sp. MB42-C2 TaxID=3070997 RepID=UPI0027E1320A|nr:recombinase family protein [Anaerocolumna sp. MB42-C2]WMJ87808.1 recombinase family protein [Anaerocolumna sp. MB42-C2]
MAKRVTTIPATISRVTAQPIGKPKKRRVAGYARVSTELEEQQTSYSAQMDYYLNYIKSRDDWEFAGMYSDEGISATNTKRREGFKQMIEDALAGKIDLIITKSVSRFARNTVDSLTTVRKLKEQGVEIYFEKENIWTLDAKGELLITIMSSLAQEESRSISENTTWGQRKRFADGRACVAYKRFLGYDRGPKGGFVINLEQAKTVKLIYKMFLSGLSYHSIAKQLMSMGIRSPGGKDKWYQKTVNSILTNEKYKGDALLQKSYTVDFLQKKTKKNEGEIPQYYVEGNHEAIIPPETFDLVQAEILKRYGEGKKYSGVSIFSSKIKCGKCGSWYGSKVWHSTDKYRRVIYRCNNKFDGNKKCSTPHLTEDEIKALFIKAVNQLLEKKNDTIADLEILKRMVSFTDDLQKELETVTEEMSVLVEMTQSIIAENARTVLDQENYEKRYNTLVKRYEEKKVRYNELEAAIVEKKAKSEIIGSFIKTIKRMGGLVETFDEGLWGGMIDYVTIFNKKKVVFTFKGRIEITVE